MVSTTLSSLKHSLWLPTRRPKPKKAQMTVLRSSIDYTRRLSRIYLKMLLLKWRSVWKSINS
jgi:hypothetical protein